MPTRSGGSSSRTMPNASGKGAPAAPCRARAAISTPIESGSAAPTVPTVPTAKIIFSQRVPPFPPVP